MTQVNFLVSQIGSLPRLKGVPANNTGDGPWNPGGGYQPGQSV